MNVCSLDSIRCLSLKCRSGRRNICVRTGTVLAVTVATLLIAGTSLFAADSKDRAECPDAGIRYILPNSATGSSMATVTESAPLAHTSQILALDEDTQIVGAGNAGRQTARILETIDLVLNQAGAGLDDLLKLNVYVTSNRVAEEVRAEFASTFSGRAKPAVSFVVGNLSHPDALVAIDAVAAACGETEAVRTVQRMGAPGVRSTRGAVAVLPAGGKMYVSGQVAPGELITATAGTMENLFATLAYYGLSADDVVQVKAFMPDISRASEVEDEIDAYFKEKPAPPFVPVEWTDETYLGYLSTEGEDATPIEIEVIAARGEGPAGTPAPDEPSSYLAYPGLETFPTYSRAVEYHRGEIIYVSGLYGDPSKEAESQVREIFDTLEKVLREAGSDMDHLLKGTYYVAGPEPNTWLDQIRAELYNPTRAPASSKMPVSEVGMEGAIITLDMIGVVP